jgi:AcrR family transcriptional regulator
MGEFGIQGRSQRRNANRKAQILESATQLFAKKGFQATTIKEIAILADLSEGSIYNYFVDKEQIFATLLDKLIEEQSMYGMFTKTLPADTRSFLDEVFDMQHEFVNDNRDLIRAVLPEVLINETYREKFFREFYTPAISFFILQFQARSVLGQIRPVNHQMLSRSLVGMLYGFYILQLLEDPTMIENWGSLLGQTISLIYEGLSTATVP